ncbi:cobalt ABC transporter [Chroococcidiopsis sp. CCALA 051]|uniref:ABC transporter ATP-binding protein n=1 Tax=Chroococcidiopsis sp. CCALA 051 TaxID=869949 RepID=UPI000D0D660F|nr:ATP-binding cassette domain-containing protein [Chroococcidiopsis sp. CCALA 051]PSM50663.1 cobalt ABC transporter [Chroococcidiopsis sp. CCALA 051]
MRSEVAQLRLEGVSLAATIGSQYLLQDISFEAFPGDRIAIIGASGAGKTSLLRIVNRLSEPTAGSIYLEDKEYGQIPAIQLRQQVTLVMQESKLLGMTVREALQYPLVLRKMPRSQIQQQIAYWMERLNIPEDWLEKTELQLSVGQKQLVAIARALATQPKILLLDEPTSALDAGKASHLIEVLIQLADSGQTTILMVNHQLELAKQFCTQVLFLQAGRLSQNASNSSQLDWDKLKANLIQAETKATQEWL